MTHAVYSEDFTSTVIQRNVLRSHHMDLDQKLQEFQQKYVNLEQQATPGSLERHVYGQINSLIRREQDTTPALNRARQTKIWLHDLAKDFNPESKRHMIVEAVKELKQIAGLPPIR
jgi:hypothetical protein